MLKLLSETGRVHVYSKNNNGRMPLSLAARNGNMAAVKPLPETSIGDSIDIGEGQ